MFDYKRIVYVALFDTLYIVISLYILYVAFSDNTEKLKNAKKQKRSQRIYIQCVEVLCNTHFWHITALLH